MTFADKSLDEIRTEMNARYAGGAPYDETLPWDEVRMDRIRGAAVELARYPEDERQNPRQVCATLDIGCGDGGGVTTYWPQKNDLVGIDLSERAIEQARRRHPRARFEVAAIEEYETEERFETIVAVESIEHWADVSRGLRNVRRLLAPGGYFVVTTPNRDSLHARVGRRLGVSIPFCSDDHVHEYGYRELIALLEQHGFRVTRSIGAMLMPYWALESEVGHRIRKLTDHDYELIELLAKAGEHVPEIAFVQCHACQAVMR